MESNSLNETILQFNSDFSNIYNHFTMSLPHMSFTHDNPLSLYL
jgi:hypothetical protein